LKDGVLETEDLRIVAVALALAGRTRDAADMLRAVIARATEHDRPLLVATAQRDLAGLLHRTGDHAAATVMAQAARATFRRRAALGITAAALLGCGESPLAPVPPPPQASLIGSILQATGLLGCTPMPTATAKQTVGAAGGVIRIGPHTLSIPAGALDAAVTITATAPSDNVNRVRFQPEGLVFRRSAALTMSYANCNLLGTLLPKRI